MAQKLLHFFIWHQMFTMQLTITMAVKLLVLTLIVLIFIAFTLKATPRIQSRKERDEVEKNNGNDKLYNGIDKLTLMLIFSVYLSFHADFQSLVEIIEQPLFRLIGSVIFGLDGS